MTTIEIISPIPGKGLGREYLSRAVVLDELNYIELGAIVRDDLGNALNNVVVDVSATDGTQNKEMDGTGNVTKVYVNGKAVLTPYYPFHYEFHTTDNHVIDFGCGLSGYQVTLFATMDTRP